MDHVWDQFGGSFRVRVKSKSGLCLKRLLEAPGSRLESHLGCLGALLGGRGFQKPCNNQYKAHVLKTVCECYLSVLRTVLEPPWLMFGRFLIPKWGPTCNKTKTNTQSVVIFGPVSIPLCATREGTCSLCISQVWELPKQLNYENGAKCPAAGNIFSIRRGVIYMYLYESFSLLSLLICSQRRMGCYKFCNLPPLVSPASLASWASLASVVSWLPRLLRLHQNLKTQLGICNSTSSEPWSILGG
jgi:hypothetical protein